MCPPRVFKMTSAEKIEEKISLECMQQELFRGDKTELAHARCR